MSPMTMVMLLADCESRNSISISYIGVSAWSKSTMLCGSNLMSCRTISLPIEPAAPVTSMVLPLTCSCIRLKSSLIGLRSSKSSILMFLICFELNSPLIQLSNLGTLSILMPLFRPSSIISCFFSTDWNGLARRRWWTSCSSISSAMLSIG